VPAAVNRLTVAGKAARRRKATIYRDFPAVADRFARRGKPKTAAADKHFVVVFADYISFYRTSSLSLQVSLEVIKVVKDDSQE